MPPLPNSFQFSQASLQDFLDCHRRFYLRYRLALRWPAVEVAPIEEYERKMVLGKAFHQMVQQYTVGVPVDLIQRMSLAPEMAPELPSWWRNFLVYRPIDLFGGQAEGAVVRSELTLTGVSGVGRLVARYDLLILLPGEQAVILDWKTGIKRAREQDLAGRMQTRLYRYLLVQAGTALNGGRSIDPEQVEMIYWFPEFPDAPARFPYGSLAYAEDGAYLTHLIGQIAGMEDSDFEMTEDTRQCLYCTYRSYCDRGVRAGTLDDVAAEWDLHEQGESLDISFDQVSEIEY